MACRGVAQARWVREPLLFLPYCPTPTLPLRCDVHGTLQPVWPGADLSEQPTVHGAGPDPLPSPALCSAPEHIVGSLRTPFPPHPPVKGQGSPCAASVSFRAFRPKVALEQKWGIEPVRQKGAQGWELSLAPVLCSVLRAPGPH